MIKYQEYSGKFFWALAPLWWGLITYFLAYGAGMQLNISYSVRLLIAIFLVSYYFYKSLEHSRLHTTALIFNYPIRTPGWELLVGVTIGLLLLYRLFFTWGTYPVFDSLVLGVFGSSCLEELLSRMVFIKYRMKPLEFIFFNILSACAFTLMHTGYEPIMPSLIELFSRGHFQFSFLLGIIAYKTQRIEIPIIVHMLSNLLRYTVPFLIFGQELPLIAIISLTCGELLLVAGASHKAIEK
ncbi:MAG: CPBP family intramembrane metalloprotease [Candidatus Babeliaceae bacterium]|nr:CPBP family intramembrane metalloprotease [Candidatus Babeliaceae bacterium]